MASTDAAVNGRGLPPQASQGQWVRRLAAGLLLFLSAMTCFPVDGLATTITLPFGVGLALPTTFVSGFGVSSDGASFNDALNGTPTANGGSSAALPAWISKGAKGGMVAGTARATLRQAADKTWVAQLYTRATAVGVPVDAGGNGVTAQAISIASAGGKLRFSASGTFFDNIDPILVTEGTADAQYSFDIVLDGQTIFTAGATLDNGALTTEGAFSDSDFSLTTVGDTVTATLTHTFFAIPVTLSPSQIEADLSFQADQMFSADAINGGMAIAESLPEPPSLPMAIFGIGATFLVRRRRRRRP